MGGGHKRSKAHISMPCFSSIAARSMEVFLSFFRNHCCTIQLLFETSKHQSVGYKTDLFKQSMFHINCSSNDIVNESWKQKFLNLEAEKPEDIYLSFTLVCICHANL